MTLDKYFKEFQSNIEPSRTTRQEIQRIHTNLRSFLSNEGSYSKIVDSTFLSGSYAKNTCIRPVRSDRKRDVDIDVVTTYTLKDDPVAILEELETVLRMQPTYNTTRRQSHSVCVEMSGLDIDVVPLIFDRGTDHYYIGSRDTGSWAIATPKEHIQWSSDVNQNNDMKYKPLVKLFKWWRRENCPNGVRFPKGIALEAIIANNLGDVSSSTENLMIETMRSIVRVYKEYAIGHLVPVLHDPAIYSNNLLAKTSAYDFKMYIDKLEEHLSLIDTEGKNNNVWKKILGDEFPSQDRKTMNLENYKRVSYRQVPPWPMPHNPSIAVKAEVTFPDGTYRVLENNGMSLPKGSIIKYSAAYPITSDIRIKWQVVNTGKEAQEAGCLRGGFENSGNENSGLMSRKESTAYTGKHYVQCFVVKHGRCVAYSEEFFINVE